MGRSDLTAQIRRLADDLGFDAIGVAPAHALDSGPLREWLNRDYHGEMQWLERKPEARTDPSLVLPGVRSIVSLALNYGHSYELPYHDSARGAISRYAAGDDYHDVLERKLESLLGAVRKIEPGAQGRYYVDTGPVLDKVWGARAGIGWIGKHTNLLSRDAGSWFFLAELLLTVELEYDSPSGDFCGSCTRCIEACPTNAIVEPYVLDSRRCISYLTIELRDDIPTRFRPAMANLIFGCDICQDVCPWNGRAPGSRVDEFAPRPENRAPTLRELARVAPDDFARRFSSSPVKRTKWRGLMRNVAVALGNAGDPESIPELVGLLNCSDPMVRRHAGWALSCVGTGSAVDALGRRLALEKDPRTVEVLEGLLAHGSAKPQGRTPDDSPVS